MALQFKINESAFNNLPADIKTEYIKNDDGSYSLDVSGLEDTGALKRAKDREAQLRKDAEKELKEARERLQTFEGDDARRNGDIATLEKSWQGKLDAQKAEFEGKAAKLHNHIKHSLVDSFAASIAAEISTNPKLLMPLIKSRLVADFEGEAPVTRVLSADGKVSAMTIDELKKEFVENKDYSVIIKGSLASGGASGKHPTKTPPSSAKPDSEINLASAKPSDLVARINAKKEAAADNQ